MFSNIKDIVSSKSSVTLDFKKDITATLYHLNPSKTTDIVLWNTADKACLFVCFFSAQ